MAVDGATVRGVIDHLGLQCADPAAAAAFYLRVFAPCGVCEAMRIDTPHGPVVGLAGEAGQPQLWVGPLEDAGHRPVHLALVAPSRAAVDAAHAAAMAAGGRDEGAPGPRPHFAPDYYGAYVRDLDGNKLHFVFRGE